MLLDSIAFHGFSGHNESKLLFNITYDKFHDDDLPDLSAAIYDHDGHLVAVLNVTSHATYLEPEFILIDIDHIRDLLKDQNTVVDDSFGMIICVNRHARSRFFLIKHDGIEFTADGRPRIEYPRKVKTIVEEPSDDGLYEDPHHEQRLIFDYLKSRIRHKNASSQPNLATDIKSYEQYTN